MPALLALLPAWAQGWALKAAMVGIAILIVGMALLRIRESGKIAERYNNLEKMAEAENVRRKIDAAVARTPADERKRMLEKYYRD
jgi:hypothetical protein